MCGFAGFLSHQMPDSSQAILRRMADSIRHRGPDGEGYWLDKNAGIGFSHRRLAILDLSAAGHQPMHSANQRFVLIYNGEIYNHIKIRNEIDKVHSINWRGHSDTETLVEGFNIWGIKATIERAIGMFAFAVWDREMSILTLGRDRIGEKPLYYGWQDNTFLFGSELKALRQHSAFKNKLNQTAIQLFLNYNYISAPYSIYDGISKLIPGTLLTVSLKKTEPQLSPYWSVIEVAKKGLEFLLTDSKEALVSELEILLKDAVSKQMLADVQLGAFLSGGVDSSTVVSLMQAQSSRPIKTFTIGFNEKNYNEAKYAKAIAAHLGTDHTELYVTEKEAAAVIPQLSFIYDEPFADSSQIPTILLSGLARKKVVVSLSGDGGDELFCGYSRYSELNQRRINFSLFPAYLRASLGKIISGLSFFSLNQILSHKLQRAKALLLAKSDSSFYANCISNSANPISILGYDDSILVKKSESNFFPDFINGMMMEDMLSYLPDDILTKVDRAAMNVSLESRMPFLDHRVIDFAWRLPVSLKLHQNKNKWILRQVLSRYVPEKLINRPKKGFSVPLGDWLRNPLREWAEDLLSESRLRQEGLFDPQPIIKKWSEHLGRKKNWGYYLWAICIFQQWLENLKKST